LRRRGGRACSTSSWVAAGFEAVARVFGATLSAASEGDRVAERARASLTDTGRPPAAASRALRVAATLACLSGLRREGLLALDLRLDHLHEGFTIFVVVLAGAEFARHGRDQLLRHAPFGRFERGLLGRQVQLPDVADLVGPVEGGEQHRRPERIDGCKCLAVLDHHLADRGEPLLGQDLLEEREGLSADRIRFDVVGPLHESCRSVVGVALDELLDLDGPDRLERHGFEILVRDDHVLARGPFVAPDRFAPRDDRFVGGAPDFHLDPCQVVLMQQVEADLAVRLGRKVELHGDGDEAELDGPFPHRARHEGPRWQSLVLAEGPGR